MLTEEVALTCFGGSHRIAERLRARHDQLFREHEFISQLPTAKVEYLDFMWARVMVLTRAFMVPRVSGETNPETIRRRRALSRKHNTSTHRSGRRPSTEFMVVLVPFADLLNHESKPNAGWTFSPERGFEIHAKTDIMPGTTVVTSYGAKSNEALLLEYGFAGSPNLQDMFEIQMDVHGKNKTIAMSLRPLDTHDINGLFQFLRGFSNNRSRVLEEEALQTFLAACTHWVTAAPVVPEPCEQYLQVRAQIATVWVETLQHCLSILRTQRLPDIGEDTIYKMLISLYVWSWVLDAGASLLPENIVQDASLRLGQLSATAMLQMMI